MDNLPKTDPDLAINAPILLEALKRTVNRFVFDGVMEAIVHELNEEAQSSSLDNKPQIMMLNRVNSLLLYSALNPDKIVKEQQFGESFIYGVSISDALIISTETPRIIAAGVTYSENIPRYRRREIQIPLDSIRAVRMESLAPISDNPIFYVVLPSDLAKTVGSYNASAIELYTLPYTKLLFETEIFKPLISSVKVKTDGKTILEKLPVLQKHF